MDLDLIAASLDAHKLAAHEDMWNPSSVADTAQVWINGSALGATAAQVSKVMNAHEQIEFRYPSPWPPPRPSLWARAWAPIFRGLGLGEDAA